MWGLAAVRPSLHSEPVNQTLTCRFTGWEQESLSSSSFSLYSRQTHVCWLPLLKLSRECHFRSRPVTESPIICMLFPRPRKCETLARGPLGRQAGQASSPQTEPQTQCLKRTPYRASRGQDCVSGWLWVGPRWC